MAQNFFLTVNLKLICTPGLAGKAQQISIPE